MTPRSQPRRARDSSRVNLLISLAFHSAVVGALTWFAAREGLLGSELRKIAVQLVKETPPEPAKPKEPEKPAVPAPAPKPEEPAPAPSAPVPPPPKVTQAANSPPPTGSAPPPVAPPPAALPAFVFGGGRAVESSGDPVEIYRRLIEFALRARWNRPTDLADTLFVAEAEVGVDRTGRVGEAVWKRGSGNDRWDASVHQALASPVTLTRPPPTNFPARVLVRFDVQEVAEVAADEAFESGSPP